MVLSRCKKYISRTLQQLRLALRDLIWMWACEGDRLQRSELPGFERTPLNRLKDWVQ
jgi:hypothetical protein